MKQKSARLAQRYVAALRKHLKPGPQASSEPALKLGRQAVALGLGTLDLARMHEQALFTLVSPGCSLGPKNVIAKRATLFFSGANTPIEEVHLSTGSTENHASRLKEILAERTRELAAANRQVQRDAVRRKVMEDAYEKRRKLHNKCLGESLQLQKRLRQLTHGLLAAQENERKNISRELRDEIAQTLLGINVRLLSLKQDARSNTKRLKNEIASTQRLVVKSARSVRQIARESGTHETQTPRLAATLSGRIANPPEAGPASKRGVGARTGQ